MTYGQVYRPDPAPFFQPDYQGTRDIFRRIARTRVPSGGPINKHGDVNRAVDLDGAHTSETTRLGWTKGLGIDLNGDGRIEQGKDGQLAIDFDGNGKYDKKDIEKTLKMLKLFSGAPVEQEGGGFTISGQAELLELNLKARSLDLNQDGVLSSWELTRGGAKAVVSAPKGSLRPAQAKALPGAYSPFEYGSTPVFGGYSPWPVTMNYGSPAFFMQFLHNFVSYFARPY